MSAIKTTRVMKFTIRYVFITIASAIYAVAIALFLNPNKLAAGGVSGIAIVLKKLFPFLPEIGMIILILNVPIMLLGVWKFGVRFILSTLYTVVLSSALIDLIPDVLHIEYVTANPMLAAFIGGALLGISMGIMFRLDTTTGGTDIIVKVLRQKLPHLKTGQLFIMLDLVILVASAVAFNNIEVALFAAIAIYVSSLVMNKTLYGPDEALLVYIISGERRTISDRILKELDVGATLVQGIGAYSRENTEVIMCVMRKQTLIKVRNIVKQTDKDAFMIVSSASEVFGEGFKSQYKTEI